MSKRDTVIVYSFQVRDFMPESTTHAPFKASRELIEHKFKGQVIEGTGEEVSVAELDAEGRHRRVATGWGELA